MTPVESAARAWAQARHEYRSADSASWMFTLARLNGAEHELLIALDMCDLCEPGTCRGSWALDTGPVP